MKCYEVFIRGKDQGKDKEVGEDRGFYLDPAGLYLIADGATSWNGYEAARKVTLSVGRDLEYHLETRGAASPEELEQAVKESINRANDEIIGKRTTLDVAIIKGDTLYSTHIGDSRVYIVDEKGNVEAVTEDQSYGREGGPSAFLGVGDALKNVKQVRRDLKDIKYVLMLTDGFIDMVSPHELETIFREKKNAHPDDILTALVERRNNPQELLKRYFESEIPFNERDRLKQKYFPQGEVDHQHPEFRAELLAQIKWDDSLAYLIDLQDMVKTAFCSAQMFTTKQVDVEGKLDELRRYKEACSQETSEQVKEKYQLLTDLQGKIDGEAKHQKKEFPTTISLGEKLNRLFQAYHALSTREEKSRNDAERYLSALVAAIRESNVGRQQPAEHWRRLYEENRAQETLPGILRGYEGLREEAGRLRAVVADRTQVSSQIVEEIKAYLSSQANGWHEIIEKEMKERVGTYLPTLEQLKSLVQLLDPKQQGSLTSQWGAFKVQLESLSKIPATVEEKLKTYRDNTSADLTTKIGFLRTSLETTLGSTISQKLSDYLKSHQNIMTKVENAMGYIDGFLNPINPNSAAARLTTALQDLPETVRKAIEPHFSRAVEIRHSDQEREGAEHQERGNKQRVGGRVGGGLASLSSMEPEGFERGSGELGKAGRSSRR